MPALCGLLVLVWIRLDKLSAKKSRHILAQYIVRKSKSQQENQYTHSVSVGV